LVRGEINDDVDVVREAVLSEAMLVCEPVTA
jgi:hypothetical protein